MTPPSWRRRRRPAARAGTDPKGRSSAARSRKGSSSKGTSSTSRPLRQIIDDACAGLRLIARSRRVALVARHAARDPECRVNEPTLPRILNAFLMELIRQTARGGRIVLSLRTARARQGGELAELSVQTRASPRHHHLDALLRTIGPMKLVEVLTDLHRGELRVTVASKVERLKQGWFLIRQVAGAGRAREFVFICPGRH